MKNIDENLSVSTITTIQKEWLTPKELEYEYGFSVSRQAKLRMEGKIPYSKIGKYIRYSRTAINQWLEDARVA